MGDRTTFDKVCHIELRGGRMGNCAVGEAFLSSASQSDGEWFWP